MDPTAVSQTLLLKYQPSMGYLRNHLARNLVTVVLMRLSLDSLTEVTFFDYYFSKKKKNYYLRLVVSLLVQKLLYLWVLMFADFILFYLNIIIVCFHFINLGTHT